MSLNFADASFSERFKRENVTSHHRFRCEKIIDGCFESLGVLKHKIDEIFRCGKTFMNQ